MKFIRLFCAVLMSWFVLGQSANAIDWVEGEVPDPFSDQSCKVMMIVSYGGYVYQYPSKWEGVYFPATDQNWLWACPSGFVALGSDELFAAEELESPVGAEERSKITEFLASRPPPDPDWESRWIRFVELEMVRNRSAADREFLYRLRAYFSDTDEEAAGYRHQARQINLSLLEDDTIPGPVQIQRLFLLGVYAERNNDRVEADKWFEQARSSVWMDDAGVEQTGLSYFDELIDEVIASRDGESSALGVRQE